MFFLNCEFKVSIKNILQKSYQNNNNFGSVPKYFFFFKYTITDPIINSLC